MSHSNNDAFLEARREWLEENHPHIKVDKDILNDANGKGDYIYTETEDRLEKVYLPEHLQWDFSPPTAEELLAENQHND